MNDFLKPGLIVATIATLAITVLFGFGGVETRAFLEPADRQDLYAYQLSDTITNTEKDTILLPVSFSSRWVMGVQCPRVQLSGTANTLITLEGQMNKGDIEFVVLDTLSGGTGATIAYDNYPELYGRGYRLIVNGTGTQSTVYKLRVVAKRIK